MSPPESFSFSFSYSFSFLFILYLYLSPRPFLTKEKENEKENDSGGDTTLSYTPPFEQKPCPASESGRQVFPRPMKPAAATPKPSRGTVIAARHRAQMNTLTDAERQQHLHQALARVYTAASAAHAGKAHAHSR
jgi:hypothetical protein